MDTMSIAISGVLKQFVQAQVEQAGYSNVSE